MMKANLKQFYQQCMAVKQTVIDDVELQSKLETIIKERKWTHHGENASYAVVQPLKIGIKRRFKNEDYKHLIEITVNADLWAPDIPVSDFIVVVHEDVSSLTYLVRDFGDVNCTNIRKLLPTHLQYTPYEDLPKKEQALMDQVSIVKNRILEHSKKRGIELGLALKYSKNYTSPVIVYDLDPGASFMGEFDDDIYKGRLNATFEGKRTKYRRLKTIADKLLSDEMRIRLTI